MRPDEYLRHDALGLAALVHKGEVRAVELVEAAVARIEQVNGKINAVVQKSYERARTAAEGPLPEGPFTGVPFLLKDLLATEAGVPTSHGSRFFRDAVVDHDSELVVRQKRAGLLILGKTNASELGILPVTEPLLWGPARNPWALDRTCGGSSGGSAAAVAAGFVPMAHGSDGGGSIRIPASCCGLFGLKPTRGRNPFGPDYGEGWHGMVQEHCISRSVRDSAALLDATAGPDLGAPYAAAPPSRPFAEEAGREPGRLRIAFTARSLLGRDVHPDCVAAVEKAAKLCESLGHIVEEGAPPIDRAQVTHAYLVLTSAETAAAIDGGARLLGRDPDPSQFEAGTWFFAQAGRAHTAAELAAAVHVMHAQGRSVARWFETRDVLLTPTLAQPPLPIGALEPRPLERAALTALRLVPSRRALRLALEQLAERAFEFAAFTPLANLTGQPAMSVPLHWSAAGLPIGTQFVGRVGEEGLLLRLAAQLERAQPWFEKHAAGKPINVVNPGALAMVQR
jgi:amidase